MGKKWFLVTAAVVVMSACSNTGPKLGVASSVPKEESTLPNQPSSDEVSMESLSFRVTTTSKTITPFDEANGLVESNPEQVVTDDSRMSYSFDEAGAVARVRIDPYDSKGRMTDSAHLMDFTRDTYQVLDKKTQTYTDALEGSMSSLSQMVDKSALQEGSSALSALTLKSFELEAQATGFRLSARSKTQVSFVQRSRQRQGDVLTTLTFNPTTQLLAQADTVTDNAKFVTKGTFTFTYQTVNGKKFPRMVNSLTTTEMKDKKIFGKITMPDAKVLQPGETLKLRPGEFVASQFSSPLRPGVNDTSIYTHQTTTEYRDVKFN